MNTHRLLYRSLLILGILSIVSLANAQDSLNIRRIGRLPLRAWDAKVVGNYAYVATKDQDLVVVDIQSPMTIHTVGGSGFTYWATGLAITDTFLYVTVPFVGLCVYGISDPTYPRLLYTNTRPQSATGIAIAGDYAYVADRNSELFVMNIQNRAVPQVVGSSHQLTLGLGITISDNYAFVATDFSGLRIYDVSNPASPIFVSSYTPPMSSIVMDVAVSGNRAYAADLLWGMRVLNINNLYAPGCMATCSLMTNGQNNGLAYSGTTAFVVAERSLQVINCSNSTAPRQVGYYTCPGLRSNVTVDGVYAFVSDSGYFEIYDCSIALAVSEPSSHTLPTSFSLANPYPNPFNASTLIRFELPQQSFVHVQIFDELGRQVTTLSEGTMSAGSHQLRWNGANAGSGQYYVRMTAPKFSDTKKVVLVK